MRCVEQHEGRWEHGHLRDPWGKARVSARQPEEGGDIASSGTLLSLVYDHRFFSLSFFCLLSNYLAGFHQQSKCIKNQLKSYIFLNVNENFTENNETILRANTGFQCTFLKTPPVLFKEGVPVTLHSQLCKTPHSGSLDY